MRARRGPAMFHPLLDAVRKHLGITTDGALARRLGFSLHTITATRNGYRSVSDEMLISIHEETGFTIAHMRELRDRKSEQSSQKFKHPLLDTLKRELGFNTDIQLAKSMLVSPGTISHIRHSKMSVNDEFILAAHDTSGIPVAELKKLAVEQRA